MIVKNDIIFGRILNYTPVLHILVEAALRPSFLCLVTQQTPSKKVKINIQHFNHKLTFWSEVDFSRSKLVILEPFKQIGKLATS